MVHAELIDDENLPPDEVKFINDAAEYLENPSFLMRIADTLGKPLALLTQGIEKIAPDAVSKAANSALQGAMNSAVWSIPTNAERNSADNEQIGSIGATPDLWHKISVGVTGSLGGFFGIPGTLVELPITTTIMFRSIAAIAQDFGEQIDDDEVKMHCLSVFSFGSPKQETDAMESAYFSARAALQRMISEAAKAVAGKTAAEIAAMVQKGTAGPVLNLIAKIAARFNLTVTEKVVAQAIPLIGAATGATVNVAFMDHFNRVACFHFGIRKLERKHGTVRIQAIYHDAVRKANKSAE